MKYKKFNRNPRVCIQKYLDFLRFLEKEQSEKSKIVSIYSTIRKFHISPSTKKALQNLNMIVGINKGTYVWTYREKPDIHVAKKVYVETQRIILGVKEVPDDNIFTKRYRFRNGKEIVVYPDGRTHEVVKETSTHFDEKLAIAACKIAKKYPYWSDERILETANVALTIKSWE